MMILVSGRKMVKSVHMTTQKLNCCLFFTFYHYVIFGKLSSISHNGLLEQKY